MAAGSSLTHLDKELCLSAIQNQRLPYLARLQSQTEVGGAKHLVLLPEWTSFLCPECWVQLSEEFR